jgi:hypothetical protein
MRKMTTVSTDTSLNLGTSGLQHRASSENSKQYSGPGERFIIPVEYFQEIFAISKQYGVLYTHAHTYNIYIL